MYYLKVKYSFLFSQMLRYFPFSLELIYSKGLLWSRPPCIFSGTKTNLNSLVIGSVTVPGRFYLNWIQQRIEGKWKLFAESMFGPTGGVHFKYSSRFYRSGNFPFENICTSSFIVADAVLISWNSYMKYYWMIVFLAELWEDRKSLI